VINGRRIFSTHFETKNQANDECSEFHAPKFARAKKKFKLISIEATVSSRVSKGNARMMHSECENCTEKLVTKLTPNGLPRAVACGSTPNAKWPVTFTAQ
jgi:hypothetical protein